MTEYMKEQDKKQRAVLKRTRIRQMALLAGRFAGAPNTKL